MSSSTPRRITATSSTVIGNELDYARDVLKSGNLNGKGKYSKLCEKWLERFMHGGRAFVVSSCTSALEIAAILADIKPGDEVIVPSYTYVTTVNSFVLRGATPVWVDLDEGMHIDASLIEAAITPKTRAIIPVHYGGIACEMNKIMNIAKRHNLFVCEDAAMACTSTYKGRMLGTIAPVGCISFQEKKNFTAGGQGGALLINDPSLIERAETICEHGTSRARFMRGEVDRYEWIDLGINATLTELQASFLYSQLQASEFINTRRLYLWNRYHSALTPLVDRGCIMLPEVPKNTTHNANVFWIRVIDPSHRDDLIRHLDHANIEAHPQFMPLHLSPYGQKIGRFSGDDRVTTLAISQILILPLNMILTDEEQDIVIREALAFWQLGDVKVSDPDETGDNEATQCL
ncbi:hypothetical protein N7493_004505 [Penicillium malachiteum]|uniref:Uncharacterized protein n=1 Tax=Penicillium malachiteum TaxID=1324776 RepID=A0AAD6MX28_9EURO|nr:hypothetical protein N7493_004505 [Penicillium malachiteum]